jgi:hypothetical protein
LGTLTSTEIGSDAKIYVPSLSKFMNIQLETGNNNLTGQHIGGLRFTLPNCMGDTYTAAPPVYTIDYGLYSVRTAASNVKHYVKASEVVEVYIASYRESSAPYECIVDGNSGPHYPLTEVVLPFTYPVPLPLSFE